MFRTAKISAVALTVTAGALTITASPAEAVTDFANCDAMHRVFRYGVARSAAAANAQVRSGHYRPAVNAAGYRANDESDADDDGTACEVTR